LSGGVLSYGQQAGAGSSKDRLFARIYGSVAGAFIGNAIGEPVEGWTWERIEKTCGLPDKAALTDPYTVDKRGPRRLAEGLYQAFLNEFAKTKAAVSEVESLRSR